MFWINLGFVLALYVIIRYLRWSSVKLDFKGKTVFITGGSSGIGEYLTKCLIINGARHVFIASRNQQEMDRVKNSCADPSRVSTLQLDLNKPEECFERCSDFIKTNKIDILINNAGISMRTEFLELRFDVC